MPRTSHGCCSYLDEHRNLVGQAIGRTQAACERKMNAIYEAKGLGIYNGRYAAKAEE